MLIVSKALTCRATASLGPLIHPAGFALRPAPLHASRQTMVVRAEAMQSKVHSLQNVELSLLVIAAIPLRAVLRLYVQPALLCLRVVCTA
jgi:hypothetical protein